MQREHTTAAKCAAAIRKELKDKFPLIKFRVQSQNFAGGNSVDIYYTDGVLREKVEAITSKYKYGEFDGMTDSYDYTNTRDDIPQAKYVFVKREMSEEAKKLIITEHNASWVEAGQILNLDAWNKDANCCNSEVVWREFNKREFFW